MVTKGIILSINDKGNRCVVRMPLFENAASTQAVKATALVNIPPGVYYGLQVNDVVFVAFEENSMDKPVILGKLFTNISKEGDIKGGIGIFDALKVHTSATIPDTTLYKFPDDQRSTYANLETPRKVADYIKWLEKLCKKLIKQLDEHFRCLKNWTQWQLRAENVEVDDGDLDNLNYTAATPCQYQQEGAECKICDKNLCTKKQTRSYSKVDTTKKYPKE